MKHHHLAVAISASVLFVCVAAAQQSQANRMKIADSTFATKAAQGGMAEVEMGNLAVQKASNDKVKQFGQRMVDDHSKAGEELKTIAAGKSITLPTSIDAKSESIKNRLSKLSGAEFDRAYMRDMVADHKEDVAEFQREADHGADAEMKAFAAKTLPTLKEHLKQAEEAQAALNTK